MVCYESEPTGITILNAKWLIMKPFGFFVWKRCRGGHGRIIAAEPGPLDKDWGKFA